MRRMKQAFLKLKSCASSVMVRCLLTVVLNGFKKPVYSGFFGRFSVFYPNRLTLLCENGYITFIQSENQIVIQRFWPVIDQRMYVILSSEIW